MKKGRTTQGNRRQHDASKKQSVILPLGLHGPSCFKYSCRRRRNCSNRKKQVTLLRYRYDCLCCSSCTWVHLGPRISGFGWGKHYCNSQTKGNDEKEGLDSKITTMFSPIQKDIKQGKYGEGRNFARTAVLCQQG